MLDKFFLLYCKYLMLEKNFYIIFIQGKKEISMHI